MNPNDIHDLPGEDDEDAGLEELDSCFVPEPKVDIIQWMNDMGARLAAFSETVEMNGATLTAREWLNAFSEWEDDQD